MKVVDGKLIREGRPHGSKSRKVWFFRVMLAKGFKVPVYIGDRKECVTWKWNAYCHWCGKLLMRKKEITLDHVIPVCQGGVTSVDNLVPACFDCNQERSKIKNEND